MIVKLLEMIKSELLKLSEKGMGGAETMTIPHYLNNMVIPLTKQPKKIVVAGLTTGYYRACAGLWDRGIVNKWQFGTDAPSQRFSVNSGGFSIETGHNADVMDITLYVTIEY